MALAPGRPRLAAPYKHAGIREAIEAQDAGLVYLRSYSPDRNPIEQGFAKLKAILRQLGERIVNALWHDIGRTLDRVPPQECRNVFRAAGYAI